LYVYRIYETWSSSTSDTDQYGIFNIMFKCRYCHRLRVAPAAFSLTEISYTSFVIRPLLCCSPCLGKQTNKGTNKRRCTHVQVKNSLYKDIIHKENIVWTKILPRLPLPLSLTLWISFHTHSWLIVTNVTININADY